jgi:hypothetical protein
MQSNGIGIWNKMQRLMADVDVKPAENNVGLMQAAAGGNRCILRCLFACKY